VHAREHLRDAPTGRVSPQHDIAKAEIHDEGFDIPDVILDEIRARRVPVRIAVPAQVDGDHAVVLAEMRRKVVERMRDPRDAVQQDQRLLAARPPLEIMDAQPVDRDESINSFVLFIPHPCTSRSAHTPA
jgi:hypothetical protein